MTVNVGVHVSQVDFLISELRLGLRNRWRFDVAQPSSRDYVVAHGGAL
jgi:hypothetical protein